MRYFRCSLLAVLFIAIPSTSFSGEEGAFSIVDDGKTLTVKFGEKIVLRYNIAAVPSPDEAKPYYARSGHIHPVFTPAGHAVTGDMCPDHIHQHAIWFAWTNAVYDGRKIDFWNSQAQQGRVEHAEVVGKEWSDNAATFRVRLNHVDLTGDQPRDVLQEIWTVEVEEKQGVYVIDLESVQACATDKPLHLKKHHYGAMGLRAPMDWNEPRGGFLTSEGKTRANGNHTRPQWVDSFGPVEGDGDEQAFAGLTVMQHPTNFRFPQPVRLHPKFSYFCYAPMVLGDFSIEPGDDYVSRFRYVVHDGKLNKELTAALWAEYRDRYKAAQEAGVTVQVRIAADGAITINGDAATQETFVDQFAQVLKRHKESDAKDNPVSVSIVAHEDLPYAKVIEVLQMANQAGERASVAIKKVSFRADKQQD